MTAQPTSDGAGALPLSPATSLEVIDKGACTIGHPAPLLFVHGAWHGAWCWDEHFLDYFAGNGYRALAVSLRGHGQSPTPRRLRSCSVADYVDDVRSVAEALPTPPVLVGHSMGGFVVQKYLESATAPAGVLVASMSARGTRGLMLRLAKHHPWLMTRAMVAGKSLSCVNIPERARELLFSAKVTDGDVARYVAQLQEESQRIMLDGVWFNMPRPKRVSTPLLVLGADCDGAFTVNEQRALARAYHTQAEIFPGIGHNMMLEPGWQAVAEHIHTWLAGRGL